MHDFFSSSIHHVLEDHNARWTHAFMLVHVQNLNVYTFIARSLEDKDKWISAIGELKESPKTVHIQKYWLYFVGYFPLFFYLQQTTNCNKSFFSNLK